MNEEKTARELVLNWLDKAMADKVMFTAIIDGALARSIGLADNTMDNIVRIIRTAANELRGEKISTGIISNILIEKNKGVWKIVVFKERTSTSS